MKKILSTAALAAILLAGATSCGNTKLSQEDERNHRLDDSLKVALANADSLFSLLYDVTAGMDQITRLEGLMGSELNNENATARENLAKQMEAVQRGLIDRRKRIEELEAKLAATNGGSAKMKHQMDILRRQIDEQASAVSDLRAQLEAANIHIQALDSTIVSLNSTVDTVTAQRDKTEQELQATIAELNTVYYVIGTDKELKSANIIEGGGFLRKTKILPSDFDRSYMTRTDRRTLHEIPIDAKKAKVLTQQPQGSYQFDRLPNGNLSLVITDATAFWSVSNILVIKID